MRFLDYSFSFVLGAHKQTAMSAIDYMENGSQLKTEPSFYDLRNLISTSLNPRDHDTVDGSEILFPTTWDVPKTPSFSNGKKTTNLNWCRISEPSTVLRTRGGVLVFSNSNLLIIVTQCGLITCRSGLVCSIANWKRPVFLGFAHQNIQLHMYLHLRRTSKGTWSYLSQKR